MSAGEFQSGRKGSTPWPTAAQFNEAIQNPRTSLADDELQGGTAVVNASGLPMPYAGNFADVYQVHCPASGHTWAVKFFRREVPNLRERYRAISQCLDQARLPFMVDFRYLDQGVRIVGRWYPIVKMRWIEGQNLNRFVAQSLDQPQMLDQLFNLWVKLAARLRSAGIAHADLQHGNAVLVPKDDQGRLALKLVDYDGMYVPALAGRRSGEEGHPSYQHPQRSKEGIYSVEVDRFSHLVICCALRCLRVGGRPLWERFDDGENLLFRGQDFLQPAGSALFRELWTLRQADAHALVGQLVLASGRPLEQTPLLEDLVRDGQVRPLTGDEQRKAQALLQGGAGAGTAVAVPSSVPPSSPVAVPQSLQPTPVPRGTVTVDAEPVGTASIDVPVIVPGREWQDLPARCRAAVGRAVAWVDRVLGFLAGDGNALLHNFFRVALVLLLLTGLSFSLMMAASYVQQPQGIAARQVGDVEKFVPPPYDPARDAREAEQFAQARREALATAGDVFAEWVEPQPHWIPVAADVIERLRQDRSHHLSDKQEVSALQLVTAYVAGIPFVAPPNLPPGAPFGPQGMPPGVPPFGGPPPGGRQKPSRQAPPAPLNLPPQFVLTGKIGGVRFGPADAWIEVRPSDPTWMQHSAGPFGHLPLSCPLVHLVGKDLGVALWNVQAGDEVRIAARRPAEANYLASALADLGYPLVGEFASKYAKELRVFAQSFQFGPTVMPRWVLDADGIEKAGDAKSWISPALGGSRRAVNAEALRSSLLWLSRASGGVSIARGRFSAHVTNVTGRDGAVQIGLLLDGIPTGKVYAHAIMAGETKLEEVADYRGNDEVVVDLLLHASQPSISKPHSFTPGQRLALPADPIFGHVGLMADCVAIQKKADPQTRVTISGPRRGPVAVSYLAVAGQPSGAFTGRKIAWEGRLRKVMRYQGETHVLVEPPDYRGRFEAFTKAPEFFDDLADYQESKYSKDGDVVVVTGTIRDKNAPAFRLQDGAVLVELDSVRRVNDETSLAEVGKKRPAAAFDATKVRSPTENLFRDVPGSGETRPLKARFTSYNERAHQVSLRTDDQKHSTLNILFPNTTKLDFSDYPRDCEVVAGIKLSAPPTGTFDENAFKWEGVSIARASNRNSLITQEGRKKPPVSFELEKQAWRGNRFNRQASAGTRLTAYGTYGGLSAGNGHTMIAFKDLFNEHQDIKLAVGVNADFDKMLKAFKAGDEVRFEFTWFHGSNSNKSYLHWVERLDDGQRAEFAGRESSGNAPAGSDTLTNSIGMKLKWIRPGEFDMGQNDGEPSDQPVQRVRISRGFYLGVYEVTQAEYRAVTGQSPSAFKGDNLPVESISAGEANEFCSRLTERERATGLFPNGMIYRLPTEAQWEYAARAGTTTKWFWGDEEGQADRYAWYSANSRHRTHSVGKKRPNAWGLHDTAGNVRERCGDWYGGYSNSAVEDPLGPSTGYTRVIRGGNCDDSALFCRSADRDGYDPSVRRNDLGFRVALVPSDR